MTIRWFGLLAACLLSVAVVAQSGLPTRPLNLTCTAPEATRAQLTLTEQRIARDTRQHMSAGRDAGVVYRGSAVPGLQGRYVYLLDGQLMVEFGSVHGTQTHALALPQSGIYGLAEGADDELYVLAVNGSSLQVGQGQIQVAPATLLSQTGCFESNDPSVPVNGLIPYEPAAPLWSDNAIKRRWLAMPDWLTPGTQISLLPDGDFEFPAGTVFIKEFRLGTFLVETRLMVKDVNGEWNGYSYEWNDEQTDAVLLAGGKSREINGQIWDYPGPFECLFCHSAAANRSLGLETAQLNKSFTYPSSAITANQLVTLDAIGLIAGGLTGPVSTLDALPEYDDSSAAIDERARGYLHSNCANCHRPGAQGQGPADFRYQLSGAEINVNGVEPWLGNLGVEGAKILLRGDPEMSVLSLRMKSTSFTRMPPLGSNLVDTQGVALIDAWIGSGLGFDVGDQDADSTADDLDNCPRIANAGQIDADNDGFGNLCDPDLNNDNVVNFLDLAQFSDVFLSIDAVADFNSDGQVNFLDLSIMASFFFGPPG